MFEKAKTIAKIANKIAIAIFIKKSQCDYFVHIAQPYDRLNFF